MTKINVQTRLGNLRKSASQIIPTNRKTIHVYLHSLLLVQSFLPAENTEESHCPRCFLCLHNACAHVSMWCHSLLNSSTSPLPIMHCGKGNTHFVYLEETTGSNSLKRRRGNKARKEKFVFRFSSLDMSQLFL